MKYQYINNELYYFGVDFCRLAREYGTPLKVRYLPAIRKNISSLKECFDRSIEKHKYPRAYLYANANKANYYADVVLEAIKYSDVVETSGYVDLLMSEAALSRLNLTEKYIICNGIKTEEYMREIISAHNRGVKIIPIFDSLEEYRFFEKCEISGRLACGIRVNLANAYKTENDRAESDRFGFSRESLKEFVAEFDRNRFLPVMLHYHQRADSFFEDKALYNMKKVFEEYFIPLRKQLSSLEIFNLGGGVPYSAGEEIDYQKYSDNIVGALSELCRGHGVEPPYIMQENGRYTVADSTACIYKVISKKSFGDLLWYTVDSSFISTLPNTWGLNSDFHFLPVNLAGNEVRKVCLAGDTCDCDDVYYHQAREKRVNMPEISEGEALYIAAFGVGAYQEIVSGAEGVYHCLVQAPGEVVVSADGGEILLKKGRQSPEEIMTKLGF